MAVVIGGNVKDVAEKTIDYGADEVILVEGEEYFNYSTDAYGYAMKTLVDKYKPATILSALQIMAVISDRRWPVT